MQRDIKKILESVVNDFKVNQKTDINMNLVSEWSKEYALVKAKQAFLATINDLTIYDIMRLKLEADRQIEGKSQKEAPNGPGISTKVPSNRKTRRKTQKNQGKAKKDQISL